MSIHPCGDPGIFVGRCGGSRPDGDFFKSSAYFTVYRGGPLVLLQTKLYFPKDPEAVQHFPRGGGGGRGPTFSMVGGGGGGSKCTSE